MSTCQVLRAAGVGQTKLLEQNFAIEGALPSPFSIQTGITEQDLDVYRAPYPDPASRRPLLQWPREIPLDREPEQAPGLGGGQRDHAQVGVCRLIGPDRWWRAGAGAVFQEGRLAAVITRSGL